MQPLTDYSNIREICFGMYMAQDKMPLLKRLKYIQKMSAN